MLFLCFTTFIALSLVLDHLKILVQVGDVLVAVGGKGTVGRSLRDVQNMLLGPSGSARTLGVASGARDPVVSLVGFFLQQRFQQNHLTFFQDVTLVRAKMPPLVRSGDAGIRSEQGARAIAKEMLGQVHAPLDPPLLPFDDTWIQEIKVREFLNFGVPVLKRCVPSLSS